MNSSGNRLKERREREQIQASALAKASGVSERVIRRIEAFNGPPHLEIKARLVAGLNALSDQHVQIDEVFPGWQAHRRNEKR